MASLLVGYFAAAKAVLDACALLLNVRYKLALKPRQQELGKKDIWKALLAADGDAHARYVQHRAFVDEVIERRDAALHRAAPLVVVDSTPEQIKGRPPEQIPPEDVSILMARSPDARFERHKNLFKGKWMAPLDVPLQWSPRFAALVDLVCADIENLAATC